jgi:hypothetical protein
MQMDGITSWQALITKSHETPNGYYVPPLFRITAKPRKNDSIENVHGNITPRASIADKQYG